MDSDGDIARLAMPAHRPTRIYGAPLSVESATIYRRKRAL
jgi:hypothetical protein